MIRPLVSHCRDRKRVLKEPGDEDFPGVSNDHFCRKKKKKKKSNKVWAHSPHPPTHCTTLEGGCS